MVVALFYILSLWQFVMWQQKTNTSSLLHVSTILPPQPSFWILFSLTIFQVTILSSVILINNMLLNPPINFIIQLLYLKSSIISIQFFQVFMFHPKFFILSFINITSQLFGSLDPIRPITPMDLFLFSVVCVGFCECHLISFCDQLFLTMCWTLNLQNCLLFRNNLITSMMLSSSRQNLDLFLLDLEALAIWAHLTLSSANETM